MTERRRKFVADKYNSVRVYVMTVRSKHYIGWLLGNQQEVGHIGIERRNAAQGSSQTNLSRYAYTL